MGSAARRQVQPIPGAEGDGLTHEEFMAVNGIAALPDGVVPSRKSVLAYDQAVKAVQACRSIDEAKYWSDRADALAAWAKIYLDDRIVREARALKLHAYRRLGAIARQIRPEGGPGRKGAVSVLREHGFTGTQAREMTRISQITNAEFRKFTESMRPPSPAYIDRHLLRKNTEWADISHRFNVVLQGLRKHDPKVVARTLDYSQAERYAEVICEIEDWTTAFSEALWEWLESNK